MLVGTARSRNYDIVFADFAYNRTDLETNRMIVGFILVTALLVLLFFAYQRGDLDFLRGEENPGEVLDRRYAAGEITEKEYLKIKKGLLDK